MNRKNNSQQNRIEPVLRWAGGKYRLICHLRSFLPEKFNQRVYHEPFFGAGSLFFFVQPRKANISDANHHLIHCFKQIRDNPDLVHTYLKYHASNNCQQYYYKVRNQYNKASFSIAQAARFIYLNKTCFNGIFRVNKKDHFNVPYGWKEPPKLPSKDSLKKFSTILKNAKIKTMHFNNALKKVNESDFVYLDPPYPPLNGTSYFSHYTTDRFSEDEQKHLADLVKGIDQNGALIMMSNADTPLIRDLYSSFIINKLSVTRNISCKAKRHKVSELVITNYKPRK